MPRTWKNWIGRKYPSYVVFRVQAGERWAEGFSFINGEWILTACGDIVEENGLTEVVTADICRPFSYMN